MTIPQPVPSRLPVEVPPYVADTGSATGLRNVDTAAASMWLGVPKGDEMDGIGNIAGLVAAVYDSVGYGEAPEMATGVRTQIADLEPGHLVGWSGGWRGTDYIGHMAVYAGNGEIIEQVKNQPAMKRKLHDNENTFGIKLTM